MTTSLRMSLVAALAALALLAAACGADDGNTSPAPAPAPVADEPLPTAPPSDDPPPPAAGACLEGEPECNDTLLPGEEPLDLPPPGDAVAEPTPASPMLVDGGLTVSEALATDATGVIAVKGFLVVDESGARLCELLAESYPVQCGGASIFVENYEEVLGVPVVTAEGVTWTDQIVSFLGEIVDGTLVVDPTVAQ